MRMCAYLLFYNTHQLVLYNITKRPMIYRLSSPDMQSLILLWHGNMYHDTYSACIII